MHLNHLKKSRQQAAVTSPRKPHHARCTTSSASLASRKVAACSVKLVEPTRFVDESSVIESMARLKVAFSASLKLSCDDHFYTDELFVRLLEAALRRAKPP